MLSLLLSAALLSCDTAPSSSPLTPPAPVLPVDSGGFELLMAFAQSLRDNGQEQEVRASLRSVEPSSWRMALTHEPLAPIMALRGVRAPLPPLDQDGPDYAPLLTFAELSVLRARVALLDGDPQAASDSLAQATHVGVLLQYAGGGVLPEMMGLAMQEIVLDELHQLLSTAPGLGPSSEATWAHTLSTLNALPRATPGALIGECQLVEGALLDLDPSEPGLFYAPGATLDTHRALCEADMAQAALPAHQRIWLDHSTYIQQRSQWSNRAGALLLTVADNSPSNFAQRESELYSRRAQLTSALLLRGGWDEKGWPELSLPIDPHTGASVSWEDGVLASPGGDWALPELRPAPPEWSQAAR